MKNRSVIIVDVEIGAEGYHGLAVAPIKADGTADLSQIVRNMIKRMQKR